MTLTNLARVYLILFLYLPSIAIRISTTMAGIKISVKIEIIMYITSLLMINLFVAFMILVFRIKYSE